MGEARFTGRSVVEVQANDGGTRTLRANACSSISLSPLLADFATSAACHLGRNHPYFIPPGAEAFRRDNSNAVVEFLGTGHLALETHLEEVAAAIRDFLGEHLRTARSATG